MVTAKKTVTKPKTPRATAVATEHVDDVQIVGENGPETFVAPKAPVQRTPPVTTPSNEKRAKVGVNTWWCPWDDRGMPLTDPCDVCGSKIVTGRHVATRPE